MNALPNAPRVSVLLPVRDGARFLPEAIESVLEQSLRDLELVVVDDGSRDETPALLADRAGRDTRIRVLRQGAHGLCAALNHAAGNARAPLLARLDADDIALPDRLERQVEFLEHNEDVAVVGGGVIIVDAAGHELDREQGPAIVTLDESNPLWHSTVTMRAAALSEVGGYRLAPAEDYDLWLRIAERHQLAAVREPVVRYRVHASQVSVGSVERQAATTLAVRAAAELRRRGRPDPLLGVQTVDDQLLARLGIGRDAVRRATVSAAVEWAAALDRAGLHAEADRLLAETASHGDGPPLRALRRAAQLKLAKRAAYRRRPAEAARRLARAALLGVGG